MMWILITSSTHSIQQMKRFNKVFFSDGIKCCLWSTFILLQGNLYLVHESTTRLCLTRVQNSHSKTWSVWILLVWLQRNKQNGKTVSSILLQLFRHVSKRYPSLMDTYVQIVVQSGVERWIKSDMNSICSS